MERFCFLIILLCILGPIYVHCYGCSVVNCISEAGALTEEDELAGASLVSRNAMTKCLQAREDAEKKVTVGRLTGSETIPRLGKFRINDSMVQVGLLVHNNPMIILTPDLHVYAARS